MSKKKNNHNAHNENDTNTDKKSSVLEPAGQGKGGKTVLIGAAVGILIFAVVGFSVLSGGGSGFSVVKAEAGVVRIPVSKVSDSQAHYFTYKGQKGNINFFVLKSSDGVIRAAFDACDVCYREKKGYRQEGDYMVCNNCGQRFASVNINEIKGGCNPAPLERAVQGDHLVLNARDIEEGAWYF